MEQTRARISAIVRTWIAGDFVYAAVRSDFAPKGTAHVWIDGRELPVARVSPLAANEYSFVRFIKTGEPLFLPVQW